MKKPFFAKIISTLLIINVVLLPFSSFFASKAKAQSINATLSGLAPAIAQLPLCNYATKSAINSIFRKKITQVPQSTIDAIVQNTIQGTAQSNSVQLLSVPVFDQATYQATQDIKQKTEEIKKTVSSLEDNDTCLKSVGRLIIKLMLQKVTLSTIEWINGGFNGNPKFIQNPGEFFHDIAKTEILKFGMEISNPQLFPFGKAWMQRQVLAFQRQFEQNARFSLNELMRQTTPGFTAQRFYADFSAGGWEAWNYMTQVPANNPLGFQQMASEEWNKRLQGTVKAPAEEIREALQQAGGFLGQEFCVEPEDMTKEKHNRNLALGNPYRKNKNPHSPNSIGPTQSGLSPYQEWEQMNNQRIAQWDRTNLCQRWEYKTPGRMIADRATSVVNYQDNLLLKAEDLNDAIAAILDALLNKFSQDIMNQGFSGVNYPNSGNFYIDGSVGDTRFTSQTNDDFPEYLIASSSWLQENSDFNIRTDLTQAVIDEQRIYKDKIAEQNEVLNILLKTIFQLDYCIPGPHPGWEQDSREILSAVNNAIVAQTTEDMRDKDIGAIASKVNTNLPIIGGVVASGMTTGARWGKNIGSKVGGIIGLEHLGGEIGKVVGAIFVTTFTPIVGIWGQLTGSDERKMQELLSKYYAMYVTALSGLKMEASNTPSSELNNKMQVTGALDTILTRYTEKINTYYRQGMLLPEVAKEAAIQFNRAPGYKQITDENIEKTIEINSTITKLNNIKTNLDSLNARLSNNQISSELYEASIKDIILEFGRISGTMVTGTDISRVDLLTKQSKDEIKYVYEELLTGPYGCENNIDNTKQFNKKWLLVSTKRPLYPFPIFYDYNSFKAGDILPVPVEVLPYVTKVPQNKMSTSYSRPAGDAGLDKNWKSGFLGGVVFDNTDIKCDQYKNGQFVIDCIEASDLFKRINTDTIYVNEVFEKTIGIY